MQNLQIKSPKYLKCDNLRANNMHIVQIRHFLTKTKIKNSRFEMIHVQSDFWVFKLFLIQQPLTWHIHNLNETATENCRPLVYSIQSQEIKEANFYALLCRLFNLANVILMAITDTGPVSKWGKHSLLHIR